MNPTASKTLRVLLVEDDDNDAKLTLRAFKKSQASLVIRRAHSGEEAVAMLSDPNATLPDIIFLDLNLPGIQGIDVLRHVKNTAKTARIPVVPLTSSKAEDEVLLMWENQVAGYLHKPVETAAFRDVMLKAVEYWNVNELPR